MAGFPLLPSAVQDSLSPASASRAPSVNAVNTALALKAGLTAFTSVAAGLVPPSGGGTTTFLRADGTWSVPAGGGGGGGAVDSVFGRTGTVVAATNDYTFAQIGSKPTTLAGYGIVDAAPLVHVGAGGGQHADVVESGASGFMTGTQAAKLAGIAANATANSSDAVLLARANHTGQQTASTISDFSEAVDDRVGSLLVAGANVTLNYNDGANSLTISSATVGGSTLADGDYGDVTASSSGTVITIDNGVVSLAKMANLSTDTIIGRDTAGTGIPEALSLTGGLEFTGTGGIQTSAFTGDVTKSAGGTSLSIAAGAVTYAKFQNIGTDTLVGRDTAGTGAPEAITVGGGLEFSGSGQLQTAAFTGDVTKSGGSAATTIANGVVTLAKQANLAQDQFIGRVTASTGVPETATITAAARTVLDDTTVGAMVNTLGGGTSTGTGVLVRANTPSLVTPDLGAATATSIAIGGGTALTTTNRTGTGNLVLATSPTLTTPSLSGIWSSDGASVMTANAMAALAIDVTKGLNTKSVSADSTFTFSGTPATANTWFSLALKNTDTNPHTMTLPSVFRDSTQTTAAHTVVVPASGETYILFRYDGTRYVMYGGLGFINKFDATAAPGVGDDIADGYGPGSLWLNATSNLAYICESSAAGAAVWNSLGGGVSDADYGDITVASGVWTIDNAAVTLAKMANMATDSLIGRDTTSSGVPEVIGVGGGIEFTGAGAIRTTAFTGDVTKTAGGTALTIANSAVTLAKMADLAASRFVGRVTASTGVPEAMTGTQATTLLDVFTTSLKGLVPASGGGTTNFLRADGTFAAPAGGGTVTNTGGNLTANSVVLGAGTTDTKVVAGIVTDGVSKITAGVAGASVGGYLLANATSGTVELRAVTGALGTSVFSIPAATDQAVGRATTDTLTNKTLTSPTLTTPVLGTPSSGTLTSCTGLPVSTGISGLGTGVATFLATPSSANLAAALTDETGTGVAVFGTRPTITGALNKVNSLPTSNDTYDGTAIVGLSTGYTSTIWDPVYVGSAGTMLLADADGSGTFPCRGLVAAGVASAAADLLVVGVARHDAWTWTPGGDIYFNTSGALTQTAPSTSGNKIQKIGYALTADSIFVNCGSAEYLTAA